MKFVVNSNSLCGQNILPIDGLSESIQQIIEEHTKVYQCPRDLIVSAIFSIVGSAAGKRLVIDSGKYRNFPLLWLVIVAKSGMNKSAPIKKLLQPVRDVDAENYKTYKDGLKMWQDSGEQGQKPSFVQHLICDSTPEARNQVLSRNPNGILVFRDEVKGFLDDIGRYNKSGEISQLLSMFDADDVVINRKTDEPILIQKPFMSVIGTIQPDVLSSTFGSDLLMSNGFNQRWLFCYPNECPPTMYTDSRVSKEICDAWNEYIKKLMEFDEQITLYFDDEAKAVYIEYYNRLQQKKMEADSYMASVYSKLQIQVLRWCGIAHLLGDHADMTRIIPQEMEYSVRCMGYFERCAERVFAELTGGRKQAGTTPNKEQLIAMAYNSFNPKSKQAFADAIGVSRPLVSRAVNKYPMLRCYGYDDTLEADNEEYKAENSVT